jgi:SAM-dependent methyltransferase
MWTLAKTSKKSFHLTFPALLQNAGELNCYPKMKNIINLILNKNHTCPWWLCFTFDNPLRKLIHNPIKILNPFIKKDDSVLDLGPGMGYFTLPICEIVGNNGTVYAADIQKKMLDRINLRAKQKNIKNLKTFLLGEDGLNIDFSFDLILLFWMFHEVSEKEALLKELKNKLKDSGKMLIVEPKIHVGTKNFAKELDIAQNVGFDIIDYPKILISNSAVLMKV